jgi:hypothetical protein
VVPFDELSTTGDEMRKVDVWQIQNVKEGSGPVA